MMIVLGIIGFLAFLGFVIFGILGIISLVKKNGKAVRNIVIASVSFVVFIGVTLTGIGSVVYEVISNVDDSNNDTEEVEDEEDNNSNRIDDQDNANDETNMNQTDDFTTEEIEWGEEVGTHANEIGTTMDVLGDLLVNSDPNDSDWTSETEDEFETLQEQANEGMDIKAPSDRTKEIMNTYRDSMEKYAWVAEEMPKAIDENNEEKMDEGAEKIVEGNELMMEAQKQMEDLQMKVENQQQIN